MDLIVAVTAQCIEPQLIGHHQNNIRTFVHITTT